MPNYKSVTDEADDLKDIIGDRFPTLSPEDREQFPSAALFKLADLYRRGGGRVVLVSYDELGNETGRRPLLIEKSQS